jgi:hypothetical protein
VSARLVPVAAPIAGVTNAGLVNVPVLTVGFVIVGVVNVPVLTVGFVIVGVAIAGLVNSRVLLMLLVVPVWTNGTMSAALMTVATGRPEMATVVIIKNSQRRCCSVDD